MSEIHTGALAKECEDLIECALFGGLLALDFLASCGQGGCPSNRRLRFAA
jgi:hypothetical protein